VATLRLTLRRPGRYRLVCTVADHEARGMRAALRVVRG
jgi:plastocyanin